MNSLKLVKGMGKKKSEKFGAELLGIIDTYCKDLNIEPDANAPSKQFQ